MAWQGCWDVPLPYTTPPRDRRRPQELGGSLGDTTGTKHCPVIPHLTSLGAPQDCSRESKQQRWDWNGVTKFLKQAVLLVPWDNRRCSILHQHYLLSHASSEWLLALYWRGHRWPSERPLDWSQRPSELELCLYCDILAKWIYIYKLSSTKWEW